MSDSIWATNKGIFLGFPAGEVEGKPPPFRNELRYSDDRHIVTIGPNGSGKTKRLLIPALHDLTGWSAVINDIKGELFAMTHAHRAAKGSRIIRLDPFGEKSDGFNPVAALELSQDFPDDALELAEAVIRLEGKEVHWSQAAQEIVAALIMYTRLVIANGSFADVRALLGQNDRGIRRLILGGRNIDPRQYELFQQESEELPADYTPPFSYNGKLYPGILAAAHIYGWPEMAIKAARFGDINPENRELHGVLSTALTQTRWLDSRPVKADLAKNPFDFSSLKNTPTTVFLILPARRLGTHSAWLRLMVASIVQKLMKDVRKPKVPVLLMMDEYAALAGGSNYGSGADGDGFPVIARNMAMFRGYGLKLWTVWQDLGQAQRIYGAEGFSSFLANAGVTQMFAPQDSITSEYFSKMTGQTTREILTRGESLSPNPMMPGGMQQSESVSLGFIPMPLLLPQEIRNLDDGFTLVFTHKEKGPVRSYVPWPGDLPHLKDIMKLDPSS